MKSHSFTKGLAILLTITLIAPSAFLLAPQHARAIPVIVTATVSLPPEIKTAIESTINVIKSTLIAIHTYTSMVAEVAQYVNTYVLQPLAFAMSGQLMKALTASVLKFVIGQANSTGIPQFVTDVRASMQTVGDSQALAFFTQFGKNSNSPFAMSIASSLRANYLQNTSLAGFWAANMCTLSKSSPNVNKFLAGDWSQGGAAAWFALTTQDQNNPYTLYQKSQGQIGSLVTNAQTTRTQELNWGGGMMSWCGEAPAGSVCVANDKGACPSGCVPDDTAETGCSPSGKGVNPGDPCTNSDGSSGVIKTPGSVITATLNKVLGGQQDQIVRLGNVGPEINSILGNIAYVVQTVQFASQLLGGSGSGGLLGVNKTSASQPTRPISQLSAPGNMGVTQSGIYKNASTLPFSGSDMSNRIAQYQSAWDIINAAANTASTSVASLIGFCTDQQKVAQDTLAGAAPTLFATFMSTDSATITAAQSALATEIAPVLAQAVAAYAAIASATAMVQKVQDELNTATNDTTTTTSAYTADMQTLQTMPPTDSDVGKTQQDSQSFGTATANPDGSLSVSADSLVDKMNFISTNATALKASACTAPPVPTSDSSAGGGG